MAQRRMFSPDIVNSDAFLEMPPSTQALYFQFGMKADDDGFVNPKMVMRMMGSSDDELKVLAAKRFVIPFENGVIVIKHWRVNNLVRKDWYRPTNYLEQRNGLYLKPNGSYTLDETQGKQVVNESLTDSQRRIGKDRIGKDSNTGASRAKKEPAWSKKGMHVLTLFAEKVDPKNSTYMENKTQREAADFLIDTYGIETVEQVIRVLPKVNQQNLYVSQVTTPDELKKNWVKLGNAIKKKKATSQENKPLW